MGGDYSMNLTKTNPSYTFGEAVKHMREKDAEPTIGKTTKWTNVKTKKQVVIASTS